MPLKHTTETVLVISLGLALLVTGATIAFLPPLQESYVPWGIAFVASVIYPLALYPLLRSRRADYSFRLLHLMPAIFLLLWLAFEVFGPAQASIARAGALFRWGWTLPAVIIGFVLLAAYCLEVIRQRKLRFSILGLLFLPFLVTAVAAEQYQWNPTIANVLAMNPVEKLREWGIAQQPSSAQQSSEAEWKAEQEQMAARSARLAQDNTFLQVEGAKDNNLRPIAGTAGSKKIAQQKSQKSSRPLIARKVPPSHLPPAGFGTEIAIPLMLVGYTSVVHLRARKRMKLA